MQLIGVVKNMIQLVKKISNVDQYLLLQMFKFKLTKIDYVQKLDLRVSIRNIMLTQKKDNNYLSV